MSADTVTTTVPLIPVNEIPTFTGTIGASIKFLASSGATEVRLVPYSSFSDAFVTRQDVPAGPGSSGTAGGLAITSTAVYSRSSSSWGASPVYSSHWEDLTGTTRFLLVNTPSQNLSEKERANARANLGIGYATSGSSGLVSVGDGLSVTDTGVLSVPVATATVRGSVFLGVTGEDVTDEQKQQAAASVFYVDACITSAKEYAKNLPLVPATMYSLGSIILSDTVRTDVAGRAYVPSSSPYNEGVVYLAPSYRYNSYDDVSAATPATARAIAAEVVSTSIGMATSTEAGIVRIGDGFSQQGGEDGLLSVQTAVAADTISQLNSGTKGLVLPVENISGSGSVSYTVPPIVPTVQAVRDYVEDAISGENEAATPISRSRLPIAGTTAEKLGAVYIPGGSGLTVSTQGAVGVLSASSTQKGVVRTLSSASTILSPGQRKNFVPDLEYMYGFMDANIASHNSYGSVRVTNETNEDERSTDVLTVQYFNKKVEAFTENVSNTVTGMQQKLDALTTVGLDKEDGEVVINVASTTTAGVVKLWDRSVIDVEVPDTSVPVSITDSYIYIDAEEIAKIVSSGSALIDYVDEGAGLLRVGAGVGSSTSNMIMFNASKSTNGIACMAAGYHASSAGSYGISIGYEASIAASASNSISLGRSASVYGGKCVAIGYNTACYSGGSSGDMYSVAIGPETSTTSYGAIAIGGYAMAAAASQGRNGSVAVGESASAVNGGVAIGRSATVLDESDDSVSVGAGIALGPEATAKRGTVAFGFDNSVDSDRSDNNDSLAGFVSNFMLIAPPASDEFAQNIKVRTSADHYATARTLAYVEDLNETLEIDQDYNSLTTASSTHAQSGIAVMQAIRQALQSPDLSSIAVSEINTDAGDGSVLATAVWVDKERIQPCLLSYIVMRCRSAPPPGSSVVPSPDPCWLLLWERSEDGITWEPVACSDNTVVQVYSQDSHWNFEANGDVYLSGRDIKFRLLSATSNPDRPTLADMQAMWPALGEQSGNWPVLGALGTNLLAHDDDYKNGVSNSNAVNWTTQVYQKAVSKYFKIAVNMHIGGHYVNNANDWTNKYKAIDDMELIAASTTSGVYKGLRAVTKGAQVFRKVGTGDDAVIHTSTLEVADGTHTFTLPEKSGTIALLSDVADDSYFIKDYGEAVGSLDLSGVTFSSGDPVGTTKEVWFSIGSTLPDVTYPAGTFWCGGAPPALEVNTAYSITIRKERKNRIVAALSYCYSTVAT